MKPTPNKKYYFDRKTSQKPATLTNRRTSTINY